MEGLDKMTEGYIVILFLFSLLLYAFLFCMVRFYLFKYFVNKGLANDYWDFNFKSIQHTQYLYKIVFKAFDRENYYTRKIRISYFIQIVFLLIFIFSFFLMLNYS